MIYEYIVLCGTYKYLKTIITEGFNRLIFPSSDKFYIHHSFTQQMPSLQTMIRQAGAQPLFTLPQMSSVWNPSHETLHVYSLEVGV